MAPTPQRAPPPPAQIATPHIARSTVVNSDGSIGDDPIRTSWGTFLARAQDEVVFAIEHRIANWTHLPVAHAGTGAALPAAARLAEQRACGGPWKGGLRSALHAWAAQHLHS